jgi:hypothetical protein
MSPIRIRGKHALPDIDVAVSDNLEMSSNVNLGSNIRH